MEVAPRYILLTLFTLFTLFILFKLLYTAWDKVSANAASCEPQCYEESDGSQDARNGSPDIPNEPSD